MGKQSGLICSTVVVQFSAVSGAPGCVGVGEQKKILLVPDIF